MGIFKENEIRGYYFEDEVVCTNCADTVDINRLKGDEIIIEDDIQKGDFHFFCDRCEEKRPSLKSIEFDVWGDLADFASWLFRKVIAGRWLPGVRRGQVVGQR